MAIKKRTAQSPAPTQIPHMEALKKLRIVIRSAQRHSAWIEKQCGVSGAQLWVMQELLEEPGLRVGQLAEKLAMHQTTTSNLVDALAKKEFLTKKRDDQDQRVVTLSLSKQGKALMKIAPKPARGMLPEALSNLDKRHLSELNKGLQALLNAIDLADEAHALQPLPFTV